MSSSFVRSIIVMSLLLALSTTFPVFASQQSKPGKTEFPDLFDGPQPRIQWVMTTPDALIVKDSYRLAVRTTFGMTVTALVVSTPTLDNQRLKGLIIDLGENTRGGDESGTSILDIEEAESLSRSLASMVDMASKGARDDRHATEMSFATLGGFVVNLRIDGRGLKAYVQAGRLNVIRTSIEISELRIVKTLVDDAIALLGDK
jgi:hypothetical protein